MGSVGAVRPLRSEPEVHPSGARVVIALRNSNWSIVFPRFAMMYSPVGEIQFRCNSLAARTSRNRSHNLPASDHATVRVTPATSVTARPSASTVTCG